jgi:non-specific protein-tyrosine kinase
MEFIQYWNVVRKRLWLVILLAVLGAAAAAAYTIQSPPQYRSTTTLFLNPAAANPMLPYQSTRTVESVANTYIEYMRTRSFANMVIERTGAQAQPEALLRTIQTSYVENTQFFRITVTARDPLTAQAIASAAADVLIAENAARQQAEQNQRSQHPELQQLLQLRETLKQELELTEDRIRRLQGEIDELELRPASERLDQRLISLREELVSLQNARSQAMNSLANAQSSLVESGLGASGAGLDTAVVVDAASLPGSPLPSNLIERVLLAALLSAALGFALAFGLEYIDYTVRTPEALELAYGLAVQGVLGIVPTSLRRRGGPHPNYRLTVSDPRSPHAESIRSLRTTLLGSLQDEQLRSVLITSAGPGEGKSFVAANLAVSLAQQGRRVILVDADLRKPNMHTIFGLPREPGFTNMLAGARGDLTTSLQPLLRQIYKRASNVETLRRRYLTLQTDRRPQLSLGHIQSMLGEVETDDQEVQLAVAEARRLISRHSDPTRFLQKTDIENLWVLTSGVIPPHPAELLGSTRATHLMAQLAEVADIVIYDTPPAATVTDAVVLAPRVSAVVQVVRAGATRIDVIRRCKALLTRSGARVIGPVLNQVKQTELGSYSYSYAYGYYGERVTKRKRGSKPSEDADTPIDTIPVATAELLSAPLVVPPGEHHSSTNGSNGAHGPEGTNGKVPE